MARRIKADRRRGVKPPLDRIGLVVARPLPYLYLAREVFAGAGIPYEALDTLPLAAEPYAAAVDVVLECAAANFTRRAMMALLRSPHFRFQIDGADVDRASIAALDVAMAEQRYLGGLDRLRALVDTLDRRRTARRAAPRSASPTTLAPLLESRPMVDQVELLRVVPRGPRSRARRSPPPRPRRRWCTALDGLIAAYRRHDPSATGTVTELSAAIRRWLGTQTFEIATTRGGVRILDAQSARFADLDDVQILGLVEGEWPERPAPQRVLPAIARRPARAVAAGAHRVDEERDHVRVGARGVPRPDRPGRRADAAVDVCARIRIRRRALVVSSMTCRRSDCERSARAADDDARVFEYEVLADDPLATGSRWAQARVVERRARPRAVRRRGRRRGCCRGSASAGSSAT